MPSIAIIGAGPSGLTIASLLHRNNVPFTIYELRSKPGPSFLSEPCGTLDLHAESGQHALEACGLMSKFRGISSDCSEAGIIADKHGVIQYSDDGDGNRPEISRNTLTDLLLSSLPEGSITWQQKVTAVKPAGNEKWSVEIEGKETKTFDLVIGGDGAWSKVRPTLTDVKPHFSGVNCITLNIPEINTKYPKLAAMVGTGTWSASGDKKMVTVQRGSNKSARLYLFISSDKEHFLKDTGLYSLSLDQMQQRLVSEEAYFGTWGDNVKELVRTGFKEEKGEINEMPLYMLPTSHTWEHVPGVTLMGDAAHLMTPFAGEGVNSAMLDAVQLAEQIIEAVKTGKSLSDAVEKYEEKMLPRAKSNAEETWSNLNMILSEDAPRGFVEYMESHGPPPAES